MRRIVIGLLAVVLVSSGAYAWHTARQAPTCSTSMTYNGVTYDVVEVTEEIVAHDDLGTGIERGCGDDGRWSDKVAISRIEGVDPRTALVTPVAANVLYLAQGVSVDELPSDIADLPSLIN